MICYTKKAPFFTRMFVAFASHHRCYYCDKVCWVWQDCIRPSDAYHNECWEKEYSERKRKRK